MESLTIADVLRFATTDPAEEERRNELMRDRNIRAFLPQQQAEGRGFARAGCFGLLLAIGLSIGLGFVASDTNERLYTDRAACGDGVRLLLPHICLLLARLWVTGVCNVWLYFAWDSLAAARAAVEAAMVRDRTISRAEMILRSQSMATRRLMIVRNTMVAVNLVGLILGCVALAQTSATGQVEYPARYPGRPDVVANCRSGSPLYRLAIVTVSVQAAQIALPALVAIVVLCLCCCAPSLSFLAMRMFGMANPSLQRDDSPAPRPAEPLDLDALPCFKAPPLPPYAGAQAAEAALTQAALAAWAQMQQTRPATFASASPSAASSVSSSSVSCPPASASAAAPAFDAAIAAASDATEPVAAEASSAAAAEASNGTDTVLVIDAAAAAAAISSGSSGAASGDAASGESAASEAASGSTGGDAACSAPVCAICMVDFAGGEELRGLPCGPNAHPPVFHVFHKACVDQWLLVNAICPVCRSSMRRGASGSAAEATAAGGRGAAEGEPVANPAAAHATAAPTATGGGGDGATRRTHTLSLPQGNIFFSYSLGAARASAQARRAWAEASAS
jgi:hypothetical protein